jgi:hypothetical protein
MDDEQQRESDLEEGIAMIPSAGPSASTGKAHCHPATATIAGTAWMVTMVSRKPSEVWSVSAVPTAWLGATSVTMALNWAESATMKKPQTQASATSTRRGRRRRSRRRGSRRR